jgi:hypothetical protein
MSGHPENDPAINDLIEFIESAEVGLVYCHGCRERVIVNAAYLPYIGLNGIKECQKCRNKRY